MKRDKYKSDFFDLSVFRFYFIFFQYFIGKWSSARFFDWIEQLE